MSTCFVVHQAVKFFMLINTYFEFPDLKIKYMSRCYWHTLKIVDEIVYVFVELLLDEISLQQLLLCLCYLTDFLLVTY